MKGLPPDDRTAIFYYEKRFNRIKDALNKEPLEWLGEDPDNIEVQKRREISNRLVQKIMDNTNE